MNACSYTISISKAKMLEHIKLHNFQALTIHFHVTLVAIESCMFIINVSRLEWKYIIVYIFQSDIMEWKLQNGITA